MCVLIEKMVNLNKIKMLDQIFYEVQLKLKHVKKSAIQLFITKFAVS